MLLSVPHLNRVNVAILFSMTIVTNETTTEWCFESLNNKEAFLNNLVFSNKLVEWKIQRKTVACLVSELITVLNEWVEWIIQWFIYKNELSLVSFLNCFFVLFCFVKWSEVKWSEVKWSEVKWSEVIQKTATCRHIHWKVPVVFGLYTSTFGMSHIQ